MNNKKPIAAGLTNKFSLNFKLAFLLGCIALAVSVNTLKNGFVLDDSNVLVKNTIVTQGMAAIPELLATPYRKGYFINSNDLYRPLSLVLFAVEFSFFGNEPLPYHFIHILLFAACVIVFFLFLGQFLGREKTAVAFIAALLFALHPIHTEVIANIKSADELLCFLFVFLSLYFFIQYVGGGKLTKLLFGAFCFLLSFLAKETAITFVAVVPLIFFFYINENKMRSIHICVSVVVATVICLIARFSVLSYYHANDSSVVYFIDNIFADKGISYATRVATCILILGNYLQLLFVPYPLVCDYSYHSIPFAAFSDPLVLISLAIYFFLIAFSVYRLAKNRKDLYAFCILFFLITLSLFSNIPFLIGTAMGERLLFLPSVGFCLLAALVVDRWMMQKNMSVSGALNSRGVLGVVVPVCLIYAALTINRNGDWVDNYTLFSTDVRKEPNNCRLNLRLGLELYQNLLPIEQDPSKKKMLMHDALNYLQTASAIYPDNDEVETNLGNLYLVNRQYDSAEIHCRKAIELAPGDYFAINNLATIVASVKKKYPEAIELYSDVIKYNPAYVKAYANIGLCYFYLRKYDSAIVYLNLAVGVDPAFNPSYEFLADTYKAIGNMDSAKKYEMIARRGNPRFKL